MIEILQKKEATTLKLTYTAKFLQTFKKYYIKDGTFFFLTLEKPKEPVTNGS